MCEHSSEAKVRQRLHLLAPENNTQEKTFPYYVFRAHHIQYRTMSN